MDTDSHGAPQNENFDLSKCGLDPQGHNLQKYYTNSRDYSNIHKANINENLSQYSRREYYSRRQHLDINCINIISEICLKILTAMILFGLIF